jgi:polysaccharide pyruvyl transferase WcaK-like protein
MTKKRILIAGTSVYGIGNMGDEALLSVLTRELHNNIPDLEITWAARHPGTELDSLYNIQKSIKNLDHDCKHDSVGRYYLGLNPGDSGDNLRGIVKALEECDLFILGGDPFNEISIGVYKGLAPQAALLITLAKFLNKPVALYSIHMGRPLKTEYGKELTKYCITNATLVTLREDFSKGVLAEMEIPSDNTVVLSDSAWGLDPVDSREIGQSILDKEGIKFKSKKVIGFNFRHQYWVWNDEEWDKYCSILAETCDWMIETFGVDILFIPNSNYEVDKDFHLYQDDRPTQNDIVSQMKNKNNAHKVDGKYNLFETLSLFPFLDMHFSNRRHSLVFAAIHGVPPVACGGEWHVKPAMAELGMEELFVRIEDLSVDKLKSSLESTWNNKASYSKGIQNVMPALRDKAVKTGKVISDLLNNPTS